MGGDAVERKKHVTYNMQIIEKPNRVSFVVLCHRHQIETTDPENQTLYQSLGKVRNTI